jgi:small subunit ribosomal protein S20
LANIKQQKKRNRRSLKQRMDNLRYRSTIKTLFKRLEEVAASEDRSELTDRARALEKLVDKAAARGAIHKNNASHKKARIAALTQTAPAEAVA